MKVKDFFISYNKADLQWAEWIAWTLEEEGYSTVVQMWDFRPGDNFVVEMDKAAKEAQRTVLVLSPDFLASNHTLSEWTAAFVQDPANKSGKLLPVKIRECQPEGLLASIIHINLIELDEETSKKALLDGIKQERTKPRSKPNFPQERSILIRPDFPTNLDAPEFRYSNLFQIASLILPYAVIIGAWDEGINEYRRGEVASKTDKSSSFQLSQDFYLNPHNEEIAFDEPKCRLVRYDCKIVQPPSPDLLTFTFSKIRYIDYLISGEHLDDPLPDDPNNTFRDKYTSNVISEFENSSLTNICGVGIFLLTRDNKIIVSKSSRSVRVCSSLWGYSASGTMDWNDTVNPFDEVARECKEETGHIINPENVSLFEFGIDAKRLYCQFSFFEQTGLLSEQILTEARMARDFHKEKVEFIAIPFELITLVNKLKFLNWEPAAAAGLLTLCSKRFGVDQLEKAIDPDYVRTRIRSEMTAEWDQRALRKGSLAVMSARYPHHKSEEESKKYVQVVMDFIREDVTGKDVLEIGCGIGRLTEQLSLLASKLTCLDLSKNMLDRTRTSLENRSSEVNYLLMFGQDYQPDIPHEVVVSSLVLIHNVDEDDFRRLTTVMSHCADTIFLFEHTDVSYQVSSHTHIRSEKELLSAFCGYKIDKMRKYQLFNDNLTFLKLVRTN